MPGHGERSCFSLGDQKVLSEEVSSEQNLENVEKLAIIACSSYYLIIVIKLNMNVKWGSP